jgi:hypothetical protein
MSETVAPELCVDFVVPFTPREPPLKVFDVVLLFVKLISSFPILISPDDAKPDELERTTVVVIVSVKAVANVVVGAPGEVPDHKPVPQPSPPSCCDGPTVS